MKPKHRASRASRPSPLTTVIFAGVLATNSLCAGTLYWDGTDADGNANGGAGNWDNGTTSNWDTSTIGGSNSVWTNGAHTAVFGGNAGTVTLTTPITVGGLTFNTTGYTIDANTQGLTFGAGTNNILFNSIAAASITGTVGGTGNVSLTNSKPVVGNTYTPGVLTFSGVSTGGWSGTTAINNGMALALSGDNRALANTTGITLNGGSITSTNVGSTQGAYDRINNSANITSNGGNITYTNTSGNANFYSEILGSVNLNSGELNILLATNQSNAGNQTLTLAGLTRSGASSTVTFAASGSLNTTKNMLVVTGETATPAGQIIGPWAATGISTGPQDYAVYNGSSQIVGANIAASAETTWTNAANAYTLGGATTLTATRTISALRYTGALANTLTTAIGANLETSGLLAGAGTSSTLTVGGTGVLTTADGGGNLYVTTGQGGATGAIFISADIADNGGAVTLVKSGTGTLTLSGAKTFTGGTVINAGTIVASSTIGAAGSKITVNGDGAISGGGITSTLNNRVEINNGALLGLQIGTTGSSTINLAVAGNGGIRALSGGGFAERSITLAATSATAGGANTFTGALISNANGEFRVNSLADSSTGNIYLGSGASGSRFTWHTGAISALTLENRQIVMSGTTGGAFINNSNATAANSLTINSDLAIGTAGNKALTLGGVNTGANSFGGIIADGVGSVIGVTKTDGGNWTLGGTNTYSGATTINGGMLAGIGANAFGSTSGIGIAGAGTLSLRGNTDTNFVKASDSTAYTVNTTASGSTINVDRVSGTGAATMTIGNLTTTSTAATWQLNFTGANGASLSAGALTTPTAASASHTISNEITGGGSLTLASVASGGTGSSTLIFRGAGNTTVTGAITQAGTLALTKNNGAGTLTLEGTSSHSGATTISTGSLQLGNGGTTGSLSSTTSITNNANLTINRSDAFTQATDLGTGVAINGTGSFTQAGSGTTTLTASNGYTGATTVSGGKLSIASGDINGTSGVTIGTASTAATSEFNYNSSTALTKTVSFAADSTGGTLSGTGTIENAVSITAGNTLSPGNSPGVMTFGSTLGLGGDAVFEIDGDAARGAVGGYDGVNVSGALAYGGTLTLDFGTAFTAGSYSFDLFNILGGESGDFASVSLTGAYTGPLDFDNVDTWSRVDGVNTWNFTQSSGDLTLVVIPEPNTMLLGAIGIVALLRRRR